ncbi:hypothetical protein [Duganella hordei]|uniref:hypothetical protein n=1 Tax=Duganella hordei TaxID=2865934 RepID=UPI00333EB931
MSLDQQTRLEGLLVSSGGSRNSQLDRLRTGPVVASSRSMSLALMRQQAVRELGIRLPAATGIPATRDAIPVVDVRRLNHGFSLIRFSVPLHLRPQVHE